MKYKIRFEMKTANGIESREVVYQFGKNTTAHDAILLFQQQYDQSKVISFILEVQKV